MTPIRFTTKRWASLSIVCLGLALTAGTASFQGKEPQNADEWYGYIEQLRADNAKIWQSEKASTDELRKAVENSKAILSLLHGPKLEPFRKAEPELQAKDQDVYADLIQTYAKLGDKAQVQSTLQMLIEFTRDPANEAANPGSEWQTIKNSEAIKAMALQDANVQAKLDELQWIDPHWGLMRTNNFYTEYKDEIPLEDRIAGLSEFWAEVKFNFAYFDHAKLDWDRMYREAIPKVIAAKKTFDYYQVLRELCSKLGDGHTNVYFPEQIDNGQYASRPPVRTEYLEGKVVVRSVRSATVAAMGIHVGDELIEVDGQPVEKYAETSMGRFESSSTPQDHMIRLYDYFLLLGPVNRAAKLTFKNTAGHVQTFTVNREGYKDIFTPLGYEFKVLGGNVGHVVINDFEHPEYVGRLKSDIASHPEVKALVFDLRYNGGGNSGIGAQMIAGLIDKPTKMRPSEIRGYSAINRAWGMRQPILKRPAWQIDPASDWKFRGPVCELIGPRTFSAAEDFTSMFIGSKLGPVIGEPSAGSTGQPLFIWLPGGGSARICVKRDTLPDGTKFVGKGITPDIVVNRTIADLRAGRDTQLQRAVKELQSKL